MDHASLLSSLQASHEAQKKIFAKAIDSLSKSKSPEEDLKMIIHTCPHAILPTLTIEVWDKHHNEAWLGEVLERFYTLSQFGGPSGSGVLFKQEKDPLCALLSQADLPSSSFLLTWLDRAQKAYQPVYVHGRRPVDDPINIISHLSNQKKWDVLEGFVKRFTFGPSYGNLLAPTPVFPSYLNHAELGGWNLLQMMLWQHSNLKESFDPLRYFHLMLEKFKVICDQEIHARNISLGQTEHHHLAVKLYVQLTAHESQEHLALMDEKFPFFKKWASNTDVFEQMCKLGKTSVFEKFPDTSLKEYDFVNMMLRCLSSAYTHHPTSYSADFIEKLDQRHEEQSWYVRAVQKAMREIAPQKINTRHIRVKHMKKWLSVLEEEEVHQLLKNAVSRGQLFLPKIILFHFPNVSHEGLVPHRLMAEDLSKLIVQADRKHIKESLGDVKNQSPPSKRKI